MYEYSVYMAGMLYHSACVHLVPKFVFLDMEKKDNLAFVRIILIKDIQNASILKLL